MLTTVVLGACGLSTGLLASGCGGSSQQDAGEPKGTFKVQVTQASFPAQQAVSRPERLVLDIRNPGSKALPNVAVAVSSFYYRSDYPNLASRLRPVWLVSQGPGLTPRPPVETVEVDPPGGASTATDSVWSMGRLPAGASRSFVWLVTPVKTGTHTLDYRVYAGLNGKAQAQLAGGGTPSGHFTVAIAGRPPGTHVDPVTGKVVPGAYTP